MVVIAQATKAEKRWDTLFYACPGAWLGAGPGGGYPGHITVDATKIVPALAYLRRHRVTIVGTEIAAHCDGGVLLHVDF